MAHSLQNDLQVTTIAESAPTTGVVFDPTEFSKLVSDPNHIATLRDIQKEAHALLDQAVANLIIALGKAEPLRTAADSTQGAINVRSLAMSSRQSTEAALSRRKFARDMIISGLLNRHNDEWDMTDASTYQTETCDPIVALLRMPTL